MYVPVPCLMVKYRVGCSGCPSIVHRQQTHLDFKEQNQHPMEPWSGATERAGIARAMPSTAMGERPFKAMEVGPPGAWEPNACLAKL